MNGIIIFMLICGFKQTFQTYRNYPTKSEFDTYIQKAKKSIMDTRNHSAIKNVASELQDVQKIMGLKNSWKTTLCI